MATQLQTKLDSLNPKLFLDEEWLDDDIVLDETEYEEDENIIKLNNDNVIRNISFDQSEILYNVMQLYNEGKPFDCDITASELKFYENKNNKYQIPIPKYLFDVYPLDERIKKITPFKPLPLDDGSIGSVVVDLPFVISPKTCPSMQNPKKGSNIIMKRFSCWYPYMEAYTNIYYWLSECYRVLNEGGIVCWKFQDTISASINHRFIQFCAECAMHFGFYVIDEFILESKARLISSSKYKNGQKHARKYTSSFLIFVKDKKKAEKYSTLNILDYCKNNVHEGMEWEIK